LDPFSGSGTVLKVATAHGFAADGIDLSRRYCVRAATELASSQ